MSLNSITLAVTRVLHLDQSVKSPFTYLYYLAVYWLRPLLLHIKNVDLPHNYRHHEAGDIRIRQLFLLNHSMHLFYLQLKQQPSFRLNCQELILYSYGCRCPSFLKQSHLYHR